MKGRPATLSTSVDSLFIPEQLITSRKIGVRYEIPAFQIVATSDGRARFGPVTKLGGGVQVDVCGEGFDSSTVKIHCNGAFYFVFRQDLGMQPQDTLARAVNG
jgi:hypothetical protein